MIELETNPKVNAVIEKYNIEKTPDAYALIKQLISRKFPIDKIFTKHNGPIENDYFEVRQKRGPMLENDVLVLSSESQNFIVVGREDTMSWYILKIKETPF